MSWFDTAGIANFAKSALSTAQKTIDKALDIQEEIEKEKILLKSSESESFFEAFGIHNIPSTSQLDDELLTSHNTDSSSQLKNIPHGSGFWPDSWGSVFEIKPIIPKTDVNKVDCSEECNMPGCNKKSSMVLSQPHRASLFPNDSSRTTKEAETCSHECSGPETSLKTAPEAYAKVKSKNEPITLSANASKASIVTEQPSKDVLQSPKNEGNNATLLFPVVDENKCLSNRESKKDYDEVFCSNDNSPVFDSDKNKFSKMCSVSSDAEVQNLDKSEYFSVSSDSLNLKQNIESQYDIIEMNDDDHDMSNSAVTNSNDSFSRSTSVEVMTSSQCSNDISSSKNYILDLPESITENIITWDWNAREKRSNSPTVETKNIDPDGYTNVSSSCQTLQLLSLESSFQRTETTFPDNVIWTNSEKSSHFIEKSQNSTNEPSSRSDGSNNCNKDDDDTATAEVKECDAKSLSSSGSHATSSGSFVKCSVDENDNVFHRGPSPVSTTTSEKSDTTKHESEQNTSGDEIETATSSDIEILSPSNGENGDHNSSPLKHIWLNRPLRLHRSESPTSDSSKDSSMPVVSEIAETIYACDNKSSFMYPKEEIIEDFHEKSSINKLLQKQNEMQNILKAREKKILELSKENIELQENEQRLENLLQKTQNEQEKESRDVAAVTKEFIQRLSLLEKELQETVKKKDALQIELEEAKKEIAKRLAASDVEEIIKEKDVQIKELIEEGEKLSKKELQHTTIIKKLRAKEEEMDKTIKSQIEKLEENSREVDRLRKSITAKEEQEKKHIDVIRKLTNSVKTMEMEIASLKSDLEDRAEKEHSLKKTLDSTYKDFTELKKLYSEKEKEIEDLKSGLQVEANENLRLLLEDAHKNAAKEKELLLMQIQELTCTLTRSEEEANIREKLYKAEIASLQKRLEEAEERNEDLTKNVSSATRPLVRQIENLQATYNAQIASWEKVEKNLTDRLSDAQNQLMFMSEKERSAAEKYMELQSKATALEVQNNALRQEKLQLSSEVESLKAKIIILEENKNRENYTLEKLKDSFVTEIDKLKKEKVEMEKTMSVCLEQLECEKKNVQKLKDDMKFKEAQAFYMSDPSRSSSPTGSVRSSVSSVHNWSQDDLTEPGTSTPINNYRMSVYESLRLGSASSLLENLQSQLKQREGEIAQLQFEITKLEQVKESMTRELVSLSEQKEECERKLYKLEITEKEFKDLNQKYNTLLQMYGEKVEEAEELQLDLADVKTMYKNQIEELLRNK